MVFFKKIFFLLLVSLFSFSLIIANCNEERKLTISGNISDAENGEMLIGATVFVKETKSGSGTNLYGFYSISLSPGNYTLEYSYIGYQTISKTFQLEKNTTANIELTPIINELEQVVVTAERKDQNVTKVEMGAAKLQTKKIAQIPALFGEVDIIKAIQLLPGVQSTSEGSSGFSVRGGSPDQNLILLDEAPVYNASHLMGFFSVFNNDAVKDVKLYKGNIPAYYGGRVSSVLDVRMKEGNIKKFHATAGIGSLSSRLTVEGPIIKDRMSFIASGRRTYYDIFFPLMKEKNPAMEDLKMYFYDLNFKTSFKINQNNRIYLSSYSGSDQLKMAELIEQGFGNNTVTTRWNHLFSSRLFSNFTLIYSRFDYLIGGGIEGNRFKMVSALQDYAGKMDFSYYLTPNNTLKFGLATTHHRFIPGKISSSILDEDYVLADKHGLEHGIYVSDLHKIGERFSLELGLRYSYYQNIGPGSYYEYDNNYEVTDTFNYTKNQVFGDYGGLEPRVGAKVQINKNTSVKASYSRARQYMHLASNSDAGLPMDVWFPSNPNVKPQTVDQYSIGIFKNFFEHKLESSVELYFKDMHDVIDFKNFASLLMNPYLSAELRRGTAESYGAEFLLQIPEGKLNGWLSYTYSTTYRMIPDINEGKAYLSPFDKPHDVSLVLNYKLSKKITISSNWVYSTGRPANYPIGKYKVDDLTLPLYGERNSSRFPDYHRMDLGVTIHLGYARKNPMDLVISAYNAYGRKNAWIINFRGEDNNPDETFAEVTYFGRMIPSVTFNVEF